MTMPFYVSPEQLMKDRADYARKGIGRGRSVAVLQYVDGILFVSENPSQALHKISEIYDRIGFAAVGRYNEFENLRIAGVRLADLRGYSYDRRDVTGRGLANAYAQTLGSIFSSGGEKPYEVELFVAELGESSATDQVFRLTYDGQVADERGFAAMGGQADSVTSFLAERWTEGLSLTDALRVAVAALGHGDSGADRTIPPADLEVAVLDRTRTQQRKFRRIGDALLEGMLDGPLPGSPAGPVPDDSDDSDGGAVGGGDTDTHAGEPTNEPTETDVSSEASVVPVMPLVDGEVPPEEQPTEEPDASDPVVDEASAEEPTVEGAPLEEAPGDDAPVEDALGDESLAEESLAEESLAEESLAEEQPAVDEAGAEGDPAELASAESPLTALDASPEPRESEASTNDQGPADVDPSPTWSEEEWPPVAPPLTEDDAADTHPVPPSDTGAEAPVEPESADPETAGLRGTESDSDPADLWPLAEADAPATEILHREPDEPTVSAEPPAPRADRPPPPPPLPGSRPEQPEVTEDLEQEWTEEGAEEEPRGFFDLYADAARAADQTDDGDVTGSHGRHSSGDSGDEQSSDEPKD